MRSHILIVQPGPLAEVLHALPAVEALRSALPEARLVWAVDEAQAAIPRAHEAIDEVVACPRGHWLRSLQFARHLRRTAWDVAIDFQGSWRAGLITGLSRARRRIGYTPSLELAHLFYNERVPLETFDRHAVERCLALAAHLGAASPPPVNRPYLRDAAPASPAAAPRRSAICPSDDDRAAVDTWCARRGFDGHRQQLVVLNPHSHRAAHRWPAEKFTLLARRLLRMPGVRVALVGGAGSRAVCDEVAAPLGDALWRADGRFDPVALSVLLSRASLVVSGDSGPLHLAVAVGAPVVGLFGASHPLRTGPYASEAVVLERHLHCSPCFARRCPLKYDPPLCLDEISVDRVYAAALARLSGRQAGLRRAA
jgi:heptosyltransferase I